MKNHGPTWHEQLQQLPIKAHPLKPNPRPGEIAGCGPRHLHFCRSSTHVCTQYTRHWHSRKIQRKRLLDNYKTLRSFGSPTPMDPFGCKSWCYSYSCRVPRAARLTVEALVRSIAAERRDWLMLTFSCEQDSLLVQNRVQEVWSYQARNAAITR